MGESHFGVVSVAVDNCFLQRLEVACVLDTIDFSHESIAIYSTHRNKLLFQFVILVHIPVLAVLCGGSLTESTAGSQSYCPFALC